VAGEGGKAEQKHEAELGGEKDIGSKRGGAGARSTKYTVVRGAISLLGSQYLGRIWSTEGAGVLTPIERRRAV